jgi:hypothetical protein
LIEFANSFTAAGHRSLSNHLGKPVVCPIIRLTFHHDNFATLQETRMKRVATLLMLLFLQASFIPLASAGDFDWLNNLNISAEADSSGYRIRLATRFRIGDAEVRAVIGDVDRPSDAYMIFRLGELSHRPINEVVQVYRANRNRGWGVMAKQLGIKPGSREFHALKRGHDLGDGMGNKGNSSHGNGKHKGKTH